jgi:hypothetical protein
VNGLTNVLIRIRGATKDAPTRYPVEAQIDGSGLWKGESEFDFSKLDVGAQTKQQYGSELARQLLNPSVTRALEQAGLGQHGAVRLRLLVDDDISTPHWIR